ncbi:hypothetical protein ACPXB3_05835 [Gordonia sp. DT219]|uniref:hypothetical protein n=1 Tax=Gordonia sp. DT219 TaxID=3416658 RepID=UPI003CECB4A3
MTDPAPGKNPIGALLAGVEQYLSELTAEQFATVVARVRPPDEKPAAPDDQAADAPAPKDDGPAYPAGWAPKGGAK